MNCGAIPPELIDSQLFGHEKGSFTGALETRPGWFERADGGTLLLDEIGELPPNAQVRFLRVLQDGFVERIGSHRPIQVDVRVVAATHRNLAEMVADGTFREDLWYRIAVFPIIIPPLRERLEDIPSLVEHFVEKASTRFGLPSVHPSVEDIQLLSSYHWPGNIRELGAVIDRAVILARDGRWKSAPPWDSQKPRFRRTSRPSFLGDHAGTGLPGGIGSASSVRPKLERASRAACRFRGMPVSRGIYLFRIMVGRRRPSCHLWMTPCVVRLRLHWKRLADALKASTGLRPY